MKAVKDGIVGGGSQDRSIHGGFSGGEGSEGIFRKISIIL